MMRLVNDYLPITFKHLSPNVIVCQRSMNVVRPAIAVPMVVTTRQSVPIPVPAPVDMNWMSMTVLV